jgi:cob(I)alamin adenosyltransferase
MTTFYTRKGDKGKTVIDKNKIDKNNPIMEGLGELDEFNSLCGLVRAVLKDKEIKNILLNVQEDIFIIQADIALLLYKNLRTSQVLRFKKAKIKELEKIIDKLAFKIKAIKNFIIPGSNTDSAYLDYLRAVSRRVERQIIALHKKNKLPQNILSYLNRLSSLFFVLARYCAQKRKIQELNPKYR